MTLFRSLREYLFNFFSGRPYNNKHLESVIDIFIDDTKCEPGQKTAGFIYIPHPSEIPGDIRAKVLVNFILKSNGIPSTERKAILSGIPKKTLKKPFNRLESNEQADVIMAALPCIKGSLYVLDNTCKELETIYKIRLKNRMKAITAAGGTIIYLSPDKSFEGLSKEPEREILPLEYWEQSVESCE
jgi:ABC-type transport system involved in cytochrome c biogenesis ATPase subunit